MKCQICNSKQATIHLTEIVDGKRSEMHLCEPCGLEQGIVAKSQLPVSELLGSLLASAPDEKQFAKLAGKEISCPQCGFTLEDFRDKSLLGCPDDYRYFEKALLPLIKRAHNGQTTHCGKVPSKLPKETKKQSELAALRQKLQAAVRAENYEQAADIRDKIKRNRSGDII